MMIIEIQLWKGGKDLGVEVGIEIEIDIEVEANIEIEIEVEVVAKIEVEVDLGIGANVYIKNILIEIKNRKNKKVFYENII